MLLAILYIPPKTTKIPQWMISISNYTDNSKLGLLIVGDFNAHSPLWGEAQTKSNKCGELLEELIITKNLNLHNIGYVPTFRNSRDYTSCADLTLSYKFPFIIQDWRVHNHELNYSDHNTILSLLTPTYALLSTMA